MNDATHAPAPQQAAFARGDLVRITRPGLLFGKEAAVHGMEGETVLLEGSTFVMPIMPAELELVRPAP